MRYTINTRNALRLWLIWLVVISSGAMITAQEGSSDDLSDPAIQQALAMDVFVTTQDLSSLRAGPNTTFERYTVVPPAITIPAIGRSADGQWAQVIYEGQKGWIASWLLVWSGPFADLPIDGIDPEPFVRRTTIGATTTLERMTPIYINAVDPANYVGELAPGTPVEVVARLGDSGFRQYQILYNGQTYWVGSWNLTVDRLSNPNNAFNTSYRFPYGRLLAGINDYISDTGRRLNSIESVWSALNGGRAVACDPIPALLTQINIPPSDVNQQPEFAPLVNALDGAYISVNTAITLFDDVCNRDDTFITRDEIETAYAELGNAQRNVNIARSLLASLRANDPFTDR